MLSDDRKPWAYSDGGPPCRNVWGNGTFQLQVPSSPVLILSLAIKPSLVTTPDVAGSDIIGFSCSHLQPWSSQHILLCCDFFIFLHNTMFRMPHLSSRCDLEFVLELDGAALRRTETELYGVLELGRRGAPTQQRCAMAFGVDDCAGQ